jgi:pyruvate formate lyase activating enzyme
MKGTIFNYQRYALHDGPGIRTTVFLKGCPLGCWWCHNPEGIRPSPERIATTIPSVGSARAKASVIGFAADVADVMAEVEKDVVFYDESGGGVTFSGGEPLYQPAFLEALLAACRERDIHTAVDTSGHAPPDVFRKMLPAADLFLYDLKVMDPVRHRELTGVSNGWILQNLKTLSERSTAAVLRFPAIPGLTDTPENVRAVAAFVRDLETIQNIAVLPYHHTGEGKYRRLDVPNPMAGVMPPDAATLERIRAQFESFGLTAVIGG